MWVVPEFLIMNCSEECAFACGSQPAVGSVLGLDDVYIVFVKLNLLFDLGIIVP